MATQTNKCSYQPAVVADTGVLVVPSDPQYWELELKHPVVLLFDDLISQGFALPAGTKLYLQVGALQRPVMTSMLMTHPEGLLLAELFNRQGRLDLVDAVGEKVAP